MDPPSGTIPTIERITQIPISKIREIPNLLQKWWFSVVIDRSLYWYPPHISYAFTMKSLNPGLSSLSLFTSFFSSYSFSIISWYETVEDKVLRNRTAMSTRPRYFQLYIFLYLLCVFIDCIRIDIVPRYLTTAGLTYRHMSTRKIM